MNDFIDVYGIIISSIPVGEYDKRITILSRERGKISAFARGARRQGNALMGISRIFATGEFRLREGRDAYSLVSARIDNYFEKVTEDMETTCYGTYFLELADYYAREHMSEPNMIKLLYLGLTALTKPSIPHALARRIFEIRMMVIDGEYDEEPRGKAGEGCRFTWNFIVKTPLERLFTFNVTDEVMKELSDSADISVRRYIDRKMNSLDILEVL